MVIVDALPAAFGDCLWIEYGPPAANSIVLIDGGLTGTAETLRKRARRAMHERNVDRLRIRLFVITHIDKDHINGALAFLKDPRVPVEFDEIWFNGRPQLEIGKFGRTDLLGVAEGEELWKMLREDHRAAWNRWQDGGPVVVPPTGHLPVYALDDHASITLLGPSPNRLRALTAEWEDVVGEFAEPTGDAAMAGEEESIRPDLLGKAETWPPKLMDYDNPDDATPNGSSIAFLLEAEGRRLFLTADAFSEDLESSMRRLPDYEASRRISADLFKLPHHGSERNFSPELAGMLDCERYLFSTNCVQHRHPNHATILRILKFCGRRARLQFNFEADKTTCWRDRKADIGSTFRDYDTEYPDQGSAWGHRNSWP